MGRSPEAIVTAEPALISTFLSLGVAPSLGRVPFSVTFSGFLEGNGIEVVGRTVGIYAIVDSTEVFVTTAVTQAMGRFSKIVQITEVGLHTYLAHFVGDSTYTASVSNTVSVDASAALIPTVLDFYASPTSGKVPLLISFTGRLTDIDGIGLVNKQITIYLETVDGDYVTAEAWTDDLGYYSAMATINNVGTWTFYAYFVGDDIYEGCTETNHVLTDGVPPPPTWLIPFGIALGVGVIYLATRK